jgi:hypothetical protein
MVALPMAVPVALAVAILLLQQVAPNLQGVFTMERFQETIATGKKDLLENADKVDQGDDEFTFRAFIVVEGFIGLGPDVLFDLLALVEKLRGVFEFFVFDEALNEFFARVGGLLLGRSQRVGREKHFGFDVDEGGGHVDEFGGDVDVLDFELMEIVEVLRSDFGDLNVVNVHLLLLDEIEKQVEGTFVHRDIDFVGRRHFFSCQLSVVGHQFSERAPV